jgi:hypothetical protein
MKALIHFIWEYVRFDLRIISDCYWYCCDLFRYYISSKDSIKLYPQLKDKTTTQTLDPIYYLQDIWMVKQVLSQKPATHVDVGSAVKTISILAQSIPTTYVDIRPLTLSLPGVTSIKGTILQLPFKSHSVQSISAICVIEHIGLGRYGDPLDPKGTSKSAKELSRVVKKGGFVYITVPVAAKNQTCFNAHRTFTRQAVIDLFGELTLVQESYIYGQKYHDTYDPKKGFGTGLFTFTKKK